MDNSLRDALMQMVNLQYQSLNALNQLNSSVQSGQNGASLGLPDSSSLTSYTNYANPYQSTFSNPFAPSAQAQARFGGYASQMNASSLAPILKTALFTNERSKMSPEQVQMMGADAGSKLTNTAIAGTGALASGAAGFAGMAFAPGLIGSVATGAVGGVAAGAVTSVMLDQAGQASSYNKYLLKESYRFINPLESTNEKGVAGFGQADRWKSATMLRHADLDLRITDDDSMQMLKGFTEGGLLKDTTDFKSFEKKFKKLAQFVKEASISLNASYEETTGLMSEMEKRGIMSTNFDYFSAAGKVTGAFTGQSALQAMSTSYGIANNLTSGTSRDATQVMQNAGKMQVYVDEFYENAKKNQNKSSQDRIDYNSIMNSGGPEDATQNVMQGMQTLIDSNVLGHKTVSILGYNADGSFDSQRIVDAAKKSGSKEDLMELVREHINQIGPAAATLYTKQADMYISSMTAEQQASFISSVTNTFTKGTPLQNQSLAAKLTQYGLDPTQANIMGGTIDLINNNPQIANEYASATMKQQRTAEFTANSRGILSPVIDFKKKLTNEIGDMGQGIQQGVTAATTRLNEVMFGKNYDTSTYSGADYSGSSIDNLTDKIGMNKEGLSESLFTTDIKTARMPWLKTKTDRSIDGSIKAMEKAMKKETDKDTKKQLKKVISEYKELDNTYEGFSDAGGIIALAASGSDKTFIRKYGMDYGSLSYSQANSTYGSGKKYLADQIAAVRRGGDTDEFITKLKLDPNQAKDVKAMLNDKNTSNSKIVEELLTNLNVSMESSTKDVEDSAKKSKDAAGKLNDSVTSYTDSLLALSDTLDKNTDKLNNKTSSKGGIVSGIGFGGFNINFR